MSWILHMVKVTICASSKAWNVIGLSASASSETMIGLDNGLEATHQQGVDFPARNGADNAVCGILSSGWLRAPVEFLVRPIMVGGLAAFLGGVF